VAGGLLLAGSADAPAPAPAAPPSVAAAPASVEVHRPAPKGERSPGRSPATERPAGAPPAGVRPELVVVPALGVQAPITPIRTEDGALTPPSDPAQVGWWSGGARPGSAGGAAVVTGHTVHTGGGAFDDLENLSRGDRVLVRSGRRELAYAVRSVEVLSRAELARRSAEVFGRGGPARLVLITCEDWDGSAYRSNVVVTALPGG
jgi:LPXTG-site transpeptidase (sortase) family protein